MAISLYFGLPGCGKTTLLTYFALQYKKRGLNVYCNIPLDIDGIIHITEEDLGLYQIENGVFLVDEGTIAFDSRQFAKRAKSMLDWFMLHRHYNMDVNIFSQGWDCVDKRIRQITDRCFYVYKGKILGKWFTKFYRIPYDIIIPDPKDGGEKLGEIVQGYCKPPMLTRIFSHFIFRPKYYPYFDSWSAPILPALPDNRIYRRPDPDAPSAAIDDDFEKNN